MSDKIYFCGSARKIEFENGGNLLNLNLCLSEIPEEFITEFNGKKYVKLTVQKRKEPSDKGQTHYIKIDTWKPRKDENIPDGFEPKGTSNYIDDDLPF